LSATVTYTNRKGVIYYLCQGRTKTGKPRYYFARQPKGEPLEEIPEGWEISESVNGVVSLVKKRPAQILPEELAAVEAAIKRHPQSRNYRAAVKHDRIEVYELAGMSGSDLVAALTQAGFGTSHLADQMQDFQERYGRFTPVMRFVLADAERRDFRVQRWCYRGSIDDWIDIGAFGPVNQLARQLIPSLGTDRFYELY
jgi:hypothetical protein